MVWQFRLILALLTNNYNYCNNSNDNNIYS